MTNLFNRPQYHRLRALPTMNTRTLRFALPALLAVLPDLASAQGAVRKLTKPESEFSEPFSNVAAIRELRDGRVLVADTKDKILQLVDFKLGNATKVGREGSGPGEYGLPMQMVGIQGDSSIVFDPINSRYLTIRLLVIRADVLAILLREPAAGSLESERSPSAQGQVEDAVAKRRLGSSRRRCPGPGAQAGGWRHAGSTCPQRRVGSQN